MFLCTASTVAHSHLQLVPGGLLEVVEDVGLGQGCPLGRGPDGGAEGPVLQGEGGDGAAAVVPADQVQPHPRGVDAGKELLLLGKLWLWRQWDIPDKYFKCFKIADKTSENIKSGE